MRPSLQMACLGWLVTAVIGCQGTEGTLVFLASQPADGGKTPHASWQIQLSGTIDTSFDVAMYEIDPFSAPGSIDPLHAAGRTVACFMSAGTWEPWRDDADQFPAFARGNSIEGYPSEKWLDTRMPAVRALMQARLEQARLRHCDAVQLQNLDTHTANSGFPITATEVLDYTRWIAGESHRLGLSVGLSMSGDLVAAVEPLLDWGLTDQCLAYNECNLWRSVTGAGKAVFMIEYGSASDVPSLCPEAMGLGFELIIKRRSLDAFRVACPATGAADL